VASESAGDGSSGTVAQSVRSLESHESNLAVRESNSKLPNSFPEQSPSEPTSNFTLRETLIIFDWDDTILPSSWLSSRCMSLDEGAVVSHSERMLLDSLSETVCRTIDLAAQLGRVAIVTNAEAGWVQLSAAKFMPAVLERLESLDIAVMSARSIFESASNRTPISWKVEAFYQLIEDTYSSDVYSNAFNSDMVSVCSDSEVSWSWNEATVSIRRTRSMSSLLVYGERSRLTPCSPVSVSNKKRCDVTTFTSACNILQFGDSESERMALFESTRYIESARPKSFKFAEHPEPATLQQEHALILCSLTSMVQYDGRLDLKITVPDCTSPSVNVSVQPPTTDYLVADG